MSVYLLLAIAICFVGVIVETFIQARQDKRFFEACKSICDFGQELRSSGEIEVVGVHRKDEGVNSEISESLKYIKVICK